MARFNNVDTQNVQKFEEQIKQDHTAARKTQVIEGEWVLDEGEVQFQSKIQYEGGEAVFKVDNPTMEEVRVTLQVESDAPEEKIKEAEELAIQRCPVVFTLKNPVKLSPKVEILKK